MAIRIIAPTIIRYAMNHHGVGSRPFTIIIDVSVDETGASREAAATAVAPDVVKVYQENVCANLPPGTGFLGSTWIDIDSEDGITGFTGPQPGQPTHGGTGIAFAPPNVNILAHKICSHTRGQRTGRMYIPAVPEASVDEAGVMLPATVTLWNNYLNGLRTDLADLSATAFESVAWRVVHVDGHAPDGTPNAWNSSDISSIAVDGMAATQRRRLRD